MSSSTEQKHYHVILTEAQRTRVLHLLSCEAKNVAETRARVPSPSHLDGLIAAYQAELESIRLELQTPEPLPPSALCAHANELLQELKALLRWCNPANTSSADFARIKGLIARAEGNGGAK